MFIWGKKYVYRRLGYVADFCPLCREVRAFELKRVGLAGHVYYISLTEGELAGHERRCTVCDTEFNAKPEIYARPSKELRTVRELLPLTFPNLVTYHAARFATEKAIRDPFEKISQQDRMALIKEPFTLLSPKAEERFRGSFIDAQSIAAFLLAIFVGGFVVAGLMAFRPADEEPFLLVADLIVACVVAWAWSLRSRSRFIHKGILPPLVTALHPLKPTPGEITVVLNDMKALGLRIGAKIKPEWVMAGLKSHAPTKAA